MRYLGSTDPLWVGENKTMSLISVNTKPLLSVVLAKHKVDPEIRDLLQPGVHKDVQGIAAFVADQVKIGDDLPAAKVAASVPWQKIALVALSKVNDATRDAIVREALTIKALPELADSTIKPEVAELAKSLVPSQPRKGAITVKGLRFFIPTAAEVAELQKVTRDQG